MKSQPRCECNDEWIVGLADTIFDYRDMVGIKCPVCEYNMWYCAYQEDMMIDLKEPNT